MNPDIFVLGLKIVEPITTLTDLVSGAVCLFAFRKIRTRFSPADRELYLFGEFFFYLGLATLLSGFFGHALRYRVPDGLRLIAWSFSGVAVLFAQLATNEAVRKEPAFERSNIYALIPWVQFAGFLFLLWTRREFTLVVKNLIIGLIVYVMPLQYMLSRNNASNGRRRLILGILLGLIPAYVFTKEIGVSVWFNHHDISHLMIAFVAYSLFRGVFLIGEARESGSSPP